MRALIDADSLVYVIGWNHKENSDVLAVKASCDNFLRDILTMTQADDYIGVFSPSSKDTFRHEAYKYAQYKGTRPDKPDWYVAWEPIIKGHYIEKHGFFVAEGLEADDVVASIAYDNQEKTMIICSPDKDLRQVPSIIFDYKKATSPEGVAAHPELITENVAYWNFWTQMLEGDSSDGIAGIPGLGPVKVKKIIDEIKALDDSLQVRTLVKQQYVKYFGGYYGPIIFQETEITLRLMTRLHPLYAAYAEKLKEYASTKVKTFSGTGKVFFDLTGD